MKISLGAKKVELPQAPVPQEPKRKLAGTPNFTMKSGKFFLAKQRGLTDTAAEAEAGVSPNNATRMRATRNYQLCEQTFAEALLEKRSISDITDIVIRNMEQNKDIGGSNTAVKMAMDKIEPEKQMQQNQIVQVIFDDDEGTSKP